MKRTKVLLFLIFSSLLWYCSNIQWGKDHWKKIIEADAKGYYDYLPAIFIYHDLSFSFHDSLEKKYYDKNTFYEYRTHYNEKALNKYYAGTAILQAPFFFAGHLVTKITGNDADGYSKWYQVFLNIGALFYLTAGLYFTALLLYKFHFSDTIIALSIFAITFGTNLFYYSTSEPGMSHIYTFFSVAAFLFFIKSFSNKNIIIAGLILGLITLIRPVNIMVALFAPFIFGGLNKIVKLAKENKFSFTIAFLVSIAIPLHQFVIYKIQTDSFFIYSYGKEGFNFSNPQVFNFLFSYKKGFFTYTPLCLIALVGLIAVYKENKSAAAYFAGAICLVWLILSSWWNWWYGGSFGSRVMIDYYPLFCLLLAYLFYLLKSKSGKIIVGLAITLCIFLNQFQNFQYRYLIIHWENMNKELYWNVFMKSKP